MHSTEMENGLWQTTPHKAIKNTINILRGYSQRNSYELMCEDCLHKKIRVIERSKGCLGKRVNSTKDWVKAFKKVSLSLSSGSTLSNQARQKFQQIFHTD